MHSSRSFCSALAEVYAVSEMNDPQRDAAASEALNDDEDMMEFMFSDDDLFEDAE
jgi:hypothetical protein